MVSSTFIMLVKVQKIRFKDMLKLIALVPENSLDSNNTAFFYVDKT